MISLSSNQGLQKVISTARSSLDFVETVKNESEIIERFVEIIQKEDPDLLIGYNSDNFDFPYIKDRAELLNIPLNLGTDGSQLKFMKKVLLMLRW